MPLPTGAVVAVRTFGNKRGVVIAVNRDGRCQVRIEGITMWCDEEDLTVPAGSRKKRAGDRPPRHGDAEEDVAPPGRVDLHGLSVEEALPRVVDEIDRSLLRGADRVEVVHGKGSGRLKEAVHRQLASMPVVSAYRLDPQNPGVTWAHL
jgi:DNA mismatch repair protein MutS2